VLAGKSKCRLDIDISRLIMSVGYGVMKLWISSGPEPDSLGCFGNPGRPNVFANRLGHGTTKRDGSAPCPDWPLRPGFLSYSFGV